MSQLDQRVAYLVKQVADAFRRASERRLRELGLSMAQYAVLRALADVPGAPAAELARRTFVTRQSLRDVLGGLTAAGLASVAREATAGRALPVTLTDEGRALLERAEAIVLEVEERMIAGLPADELAGLLRACAENLA
ncbi:MarR family winged helix-turn-helix transcriptional regulator [Nonomuraea sp. NPDC050536]|uniref:MarR family winged helix-turn-helix transcriptional regulator n=1 Tax=Nonomuraea sp. NPDC050536 TaxID=3364366 RepID=UPI0037CAB9D0